MKLRKACLYLAICVLTLVVCDRIHTYDVLSESFRLVDSEYQTYEASVDSVRLRLQVYTIAYGVHIEFLVINGSSRVRLVDLGNFRVNGDGTPYEIVRMSVDGENPDTTAIWRVNSGDSLQVLVTAGSSVHEYSPRPDEAIITLGRVLTASGDLIANLDSIKVVKRD